MRPLAKPFFFFFFLLSSFISSAQTGNGTKSSVQRLFFEKVYLHLDREYFASGESIWFKAYLMNAQASQLLNTSNNLYVELINADAGIVDSKVIRLDNGIGWGDFSISDSIPTGVYRVRAYTNWMRNFGDNFFFEKKINIKSLLNVSIGSAPVKPAAGTAALAAKPTKNTNYTVRFFPEGGSLLEDVNGIVAFKTEASSGPAPEVSGSVLSSKGDTVIQFESKEGLGSFMFIPLKGEKYTVKGKYGNNQSFTTSLPEVLATGFSLYVNNVDTANVSIIVSTNEPTLTSYKGRNVQIKGRHGGRVLFDVSFPVNDTQAKVLVPKASFPTGVVAFTLSDDQGKPYAERLVFIDRKNDSRLSITLSKTVFKPRDRVYARVKVSDSDNKPVKANLSVAAVDAGLIPANTGTIVSYLLLESELRGKIEKPEQYFDRSNLKRERQLDVLLLTQGWRDFVWKRLRDSTLKISYMVENGFTISGEVKTKSGEKPVEGASVSLFASGATGEKLFAAVTDNQGKYFLDRVKLQGNQSIKLVSAVNGKKGGMILLDSLRNPSPYISRMRVPLPEDYFLAFAGEAARRSAEAKKISLSDTITLKEVKINTGKHVFLRDEVATSFGYPDQNFTVSEKDYDYQNLRHFLLHRVQGAQQNPSDTDNSVVFSASGKYIRPRFVVDRVEDLFERLDYLELQMKDIVKVKVSHLLGSPKLSLDSVSGMSTVSPISDIFLVYLTLKPTAFSRQDLSLINTTVSGYDEARVFYAPQYHSGNINSTKADLRTSVHWQPLVKTNDNGEATLTFFNPDQKSDFRIMVEGVTEKGLPISGEVKYSVK